MDTMTSEASPWFQLSTREIFFLMAHIGLTIVLFPFAPFLVLATSAVGLYAIFALSRVRQGRPSLYLLLGLYAVLLPIEAACAHLSFHTVGEISSAMELILFLFFNVVFLAMFATGGRRVAIAGVIGVALLLIPYNLILGVRWYFLHHEATAIVAYLEQERSETGEFPPDLSAYEYQAPSIRQYLFYRPNPDEDSYWIGYHIGTPSTSHTLTRGKEWFYYPD